MDGRNYSIFIFSLEACIEVLWMLLVLGDVRKIALSHLAGLAQGLKLVDGTEDCKEACMITNMKNLHVLSTLLLTFSLHRFMTRAFMEYMGASLSC